MAWPGEETVGQHSEDTAGLLRVRHSEWRYSHHAGVPPILLPLQWAPGDLQRPRLHCPQGRSPSQACANPHTHARAVQLSTWVSLFQRS